SLHLQQLPHARFFRRIQRMTLQKLFSHMLRIKDHTDILIPRRPWIQQQLAAHILKLQRRIIAKKIECYTKRPSPLLIPAGLTTCLATTVARPTAYTMNTTPRTPFSVRSVINLNFQLRWISIEILGVVRNPKPGLLRLNFQRMGQTKISKL